MIDNCATRGEFSDDVYSNVIERRILEAFDRHLGRTTSAREIESWKNSMQYMNNVLVKSEIPADAGVAIEYKNSADIAAGGLSTHRRERRWAGHCCHCFRSPP